MTARQVERVKECVLGRRAVSLTGAMALVLLAVHAGARGLADFYREHAQDVLSGWSRETQAPSAGEWQAVQYLLSGAHRLNPENPELLNDLGRLYDWKAIDKRIGDPVAQADWQKALRYYRQAVALRPVWPYTWSNVLLSKLRLQKIDAEFFNAIQQAAELGPWEVAVQTAVVEAGLVAWPYLPDDTRAQVVETIGRGLRTQGVHMVRLATHYGRGDLIYPKIEGNAKLEAIFAAGGGGEPTDLDESDPKILPPR